MAMDRDAAAEWVRWMRWGDFEQAWRIADAVRVTDSHRWPLLPRHLRPVWRGARVDGCRVLIRCHRGLGDTIQFIRFVPRLREVASEVTVMAPVELIPLLRHARGVERLVELDGPEPEYDVDVEVMELPHLLRTTLETLPAEVPYLHVPQALREYAGMLEVGLAWQASDWEPGRSIPTPDIDPLLHLPGVRFHLLQRGRALETRPYSWMALVGPADLLATASLVRSLDLVISVDSMPAHLAGALGVPTWTLLRADADWRWMLNREDSPWYPTMRLFRQRIEGEWEEVVHRVGRALTELAKAHVAISTRRAEPRNASGLLGVGG